MRFHIGFSKYISIYKLLKYIGILLVGLFAYFGIANIQVLAATGSMQPSRIDLCWNRGTGDYQCVQNWMNQTPTEQDTSTMGLAYRYENLIDNINNAREYGAVIVDYDSSAFSYFCYESNYNFKAKYVMRFRNVYRNQGASTSIGRISSVDVLANNNLIPSVMTCDTNQVCSVEFNYPGYGTDITFRVHFNPDYSPIAGFPINFYVSKNNEITCTDQTTNQAIVNSIDNQTTTINNNITNSTNSINNHIDSMTDAQNNTNDYLMDDTPPTFDQSQISDIQGLLPPGPVDSLLNIPFKFLTKVVNSLNSNVCQPFTFTFVFDKQFHFPCFSDLYSRFDNTSKIYLEYIPAGFILILYFKHLYKKVDRATKMETTADDEWGVI